MGRAALREAIEKSTNLALRAVQVVGVAFITVLAVLAPLDKDLQVVQVDLTIKQVVVVVVEQATLDRLITRVVQVDLV